MFIDVCEAVQHAHQKGIIHRDIKPNNILVEYLDGISNCKVIDFGIAKATEQRLTEQTFFTQQGQLIGTPAYMSPEQAESTGRDIDTRSDIYSLGVVLYQLLTGVTPLDTKTLRQAGWEEIRRVIREQEPQKPSTKLSSIATGNEVDSTAIARNRKMVPGTLSKHLRGDLDWITIKALEKDRTRRYASATEFADDIRRHLRDEPVLAGPPGSSYRIKKFIRRNKGPVATFGAVMITLAAGLALAVHLYVKAEHARAETVVERDHAKRETETAKQVQAFLIDLFKVSHPSEARGNSITAREIMDRGAERIEQELAGQPLIQAALLQTIGRVYESLGLYDKALPLTAQSLSLRRQAHGEAHADVASSLNTLGLVLYSQGKIAEAEELYRKALTLRRKLFGDEHLDVAESLNNFGSLLHDQGKFAEAIKLHSEALATYRTLLGAENRFVAHSLRCIAYAKQSGQQYAEAKKIDQEALAMRRRLFGDKAHPEVAASKNSVAIGLARERKYHESEKLFKEVLVMLGELFGDEHPDVAECLCNISLVMYYQGKHAEAEKLLREGMAMQRKLLGDDHPNVARSLGNLCEMLLKQGKYAEAEGGCHEALTSVRRVFGDDHPWAVRNLGDLRKSLTAQGKFEEAKPLGIELLAVYRKLAEKPDANARELNEYAYHLLTFDPADLRDPDAALSAARRAVKLSDFKHPDHLDTLALAQKMTGDVDGAVETVKTAMALLPSGRSAKRAVFETCLVNYLMEQDSYSEAEPLVVALHDQLDNDGESTIEQKVESIDRIIKLYEAWHAAEPGLGYDVKGAELRAKLAEVEAVSNAADGYPHARVAFSFTWVDKVPVTTCAVLSKCMFYSVHVKNANILGR